MVENQSGGILVETVVTSRLSALGHRFQRKYLYQKVERTLCQPPTKNESEVQFFYVDVSTLSPVNTTYQLQVSRMDNFMLRSAGKSEGTMGLAYFFSSGSDPGDSSLPYRTGEYFSFNTTAAQPQVRSPVDCPSRWGSLYVGV